MKLARLAFFVGLVVAACFPSSASAESKTRAPLPDQVVAGGTFTLHADEVLDGNLVVLGGVVELEEGSRITGDVLIIGGTVSMHGEIEGNLVALGGVVALEETLVIHGDMFAPGTVVTRREGATIEGQVVTEMPDISITVPEPPAVPHPPVAPAAPSAPESYFRGLQLALAPLAQGLWFLFQTVVVSCLAVLVIVFLPEHTRRARESLAAQPMVSIGLGLLVIFLLIPVSLILSVTIFLIPVALLLVLVIALAGLFGWAVLGYEVGRRLNEAFQQQWTQAVQIGVGVFITTFLVSSIRFMFWDIFWFLLALGLGALGLGAVLLTRFGTHEYHAALPGVSKE